MSGPASSNAAETDSRMKSKLFHFAAQFSQKNVEDYHNDASERMFASINFAFEQK
jgi:hypothetical protein